MSDDQAPEIENQGELQDVSQETESSAVETESPETEEQKGSGFQKRINQLTREKYEAKQKAAELEQRLKDLESKQPPPKELSQPKYEDFDTEEDFQRALSDYASDLALKKLRDEETRKQQQQTQKQQQELAQQRQKTFLDRCESAKESFQDLYEKLNDDSFSYVVNSMDRSLVDMIQESDKGPALAYHLATHIDDAERIARLNPVLAAAELARIETRLDMPQPKKVSSAPDPIKPIGSNESATVDPEKMSTDQWMKWRAGQL